MSIKETKDEFEQYLQNARDHLANAKENNEEAHDNDEDDEDGEEEDIEREYTREEIPVVEVCINLFQRVIDCLKLSLKTFTDLADSVQATGSIELQRMSQEWIALIEREIEGVDSQVTDLGALLYPPVTADDPDFLEQYQKMNETMLRFLSILSLSGTVVPARQELRVRLLPTSLAEIDSHRESFQSVHFPL